MDIYNLISVEIRKLKEDSPSSIPVAIEMNHETQKNLVDNFRKMTKSENILSVEVLFRVPIFINNQLKNDEVKITLDNSKVEICADCGNKYTSLRNIHLLKYQENGFCSICKVMCNTTSIFAKYVDYNKLKHNLKPNL
jgi:hypothetical protein